MSLINNFAIKDGANLDAFSRLRMSEPGYLFDAQMTYDINAFQFDQETLSAGAGTATIAHSSTLRLATLTLAGAQTSGDYARIRGHYYAPYTPGRSQVCIITGTLQANAESSASVAARFGYFDDANGVYIQSVAGALSVVLRSSVSGSVVNTAVAQASWNLDKLDGTGASGVTINVQRSNIWVIDFQALFVGRVRIGADVDGKIVYCHEFDNANATANPYWQIASLPPTWELIATANVTVTSMVSYAICTSVFNEGGQNLLDLPGYPFGAGNGITTIGVTTRRPVLTIRPKATFNSITHRGLLVVADVALSATTNSSYVELVRNGTLTGASFADVDATFSAAQVDVAATAISGGQVVGVLDVISGAGVTRGAGGTVLSKLVLSYNAAATVLDTLSVVCTSYTGTSNVSAKFNWKEIR